MSTQPPNPEERGNEGREEDAISTSSYALSEVRKSFSNRSLYSSSSSLSKVEPSRNSRGSDAASSNGSRRSRTSEATFEPDYSRRSFRRDQRIYYSDRRKKKKKPAAQSSRTPSEDNEQLPQSSRRFSRSSKLRHTINTVDKQIYDKVTREEQLRFQKRLSSGRYVAGDFSDSESETSSMHSANSEYFYSMSELSISSGIGSLQELSGLDHGMIDPVDVLKLSAGRSARRPHCLANDSDYSTENDTRLSLDGRGDLSATPDQTLSSTLIAEVIDDEPSATVSSSAKIGLKSFDQQPISSDFQLETLDSIKDDGWLSSGSNSTLGEMKERDTPLTKKKTSISIEREVFTSGSDFEFDQGPSNLNREIVSNCTSTPTKQPGADKEVGSPEDHEGCTSPSPDPLIQVQLEKEGMLEVEPGQQAYSSLIASKSDMEAPGESNPTKTGISDLEIFEEDAPDEKLEPEILVTEHVESNRFSMPSFDITEKQSVVGLAIDQGLSGEEKQDIDSASEPLETENDLLLDHSEVYRCSKGPTSQFFSHLYIDTESECHAVSQEVCCQNDADAITMQLDASEPEVTMQPISCFGSSESEAQVQDIPMADINDEQSPHVVFDILFDELDGVVASSAGGKIDSQSEILHRNSIDPPSTVPEAVEVVGVETLKDDIEDNSHERNEFGVPQPYFMARCSESSKHESVVDTPLVGETDELNHMRTSPASVNCDEVNAALTRVNTVPFATEMTNALTQESFPADEMNHTDVSSSIAVSDLLKAKSLDRDPVEDLTVHDLSVQEDKHKMTMARSADDTRKPDSGLESERESHHKSESHATSTKQNEDVSAAKDKRKRVPLLDIVDDAGPSADTNVPGPKKLVPLTAALRAYRSEKSASGPLVSPAGVKQSSDDTALMGCSPESPTVDLNGNNMTVDFHVQPPSEKSDLGTGRVGVAKQNTDSVSFTLSNLEESSVTVQQKKHNPKKGAGVGEIFKRIFCPCRHVS